MQPRNIEASDAPLMQAPLGEAAEHKPTQSQEGRWQKLVAFLKRNPRILIGFVIVGFFILMAIFGPFIWHDVKSDTDLELAPNAEHWLGTTRRGDDLFAQLVNGTRVSLIISVLAATGVTFISVVVGLTAGYFGGVIDEVLSFITNIFLVLPGLPLAIVIASFVPIKGPTIIVLVLLLTSWPWGARVLRAQTLSIRQREFVTAAASMGEKSWRVIFLEILPNEIAVVASSFVGTFIYATLTSITLEYLGLGDISTASWGSMLFWAKADHALSIGSWWQFVPPGLCVALLCAGLTFINFGIDELANPKLRREKRPKNVRRALSGGVIAK